MDRLKNQNRRLVALTLLFLLGMSATARSTELPAGEVVLKAIERKHEAKEEIKSLSFNATTYRRNMNGKWEVKSEEVWNKRIYVKDTLRHEKVFGVIKDGKAWDEKKVREEVEKLIENTEKNRERRNFEGPLDSLSYADYEFRYIDTVPSMHHTVQIGFTSKVRDDKHIDGYMIVDTGTYDLHHIEFELADRPTGVKMMKLVYEYTNLDNGFTYLSKTTFRGHFGFLFLSGRREAVDEYSNFEINDDIPDEMFETMMKYYPKREKPLSDQ